MENKPRSLTVTESADHRPRIVLKGTWLRNWGLTKGDKVSVTRTDTGDILIKFAAPASIGSAIRQKYQPEHEHAPVHKISPSRLRKMQKQVDVATEALRRYVWARRTKSSRRR